MERKTNRRLSSRLRHQVLISGTALAAILATAAFAADAPVGPKAEAPVVAKSPETTSQRLLEADKEQQNWITHHKDYSAHRFSSLDQINAGNVKDLKVAWTMQLGGVEGGGIWTHGGLEGTPIVEDGFMYVTDGWGSVYKIDTHGGKGALLWKMDPKTDHDWAGAVACCGVDNRGVGLYKDLVISHTLGRTPHRDGQGDRPGQMAASSRRSEQGRSGHRRAAHRQEHGDHRRGRRRVRNSRLGRRHRSRHSERGVADLHHPRKGRARLRHLGRKQRRRRQRRRIDLGDRVLRSRAQTPSSGASAIRDPTGTTPIVRATTSTRQSSLALDADTGKIKWHFQHTPNDPYDYDSVAENVLVDVNGKKLALEADRNGFGYAVDRTDGKFLWATPFVKKVTWTKGVDPESGKPEEYDAKKPVQMYNPEATPVRDKPYTDICPGNMGGKNWPPTAYNPELKTWYVPVIESCNRITIKPEEKRNKSRDFFTGGGPSQPFRITGSVTAIDVTTGKVVGKHRDALPGSRGDPCNSGSRILRASRPARSTRSTRRR